jgi:carbonic anhydrase
MASSNNPKSAPSLERLIAGFRVFRARYFEQRPELYAELATAQRPDVLVIGCSDSRADPAILLGAEPGELFVVRNVANLVPPYQPDGHFHGTSSAIEFAVRDLNVGHIIVLGHSGCGGIQALMSANQGKRADREFIAGWVSIAGRARAGLAADPAKNAPESSRHVEQAAIRVSLENLLTFPWINRPASEGKLALHGWWFDIDSGELWGTDAPTDEFRILR